MSTLAHIGGATHADFSRSETRELYAAITAALANGARTREEVLGALPPEQRAHAEWIEAAGAEQFAEVDRLPPEQLVKRAAELVTALRLLNVRRELDQLAQVQREEPDNLALRRRVGELTAWMHKARQAYPRAEFISRAALGREREPLPKRVSIEELRRRRNERGA